MQLTRLDDYQSWLIELAGKRVAIDPWLTHEYGNWVLGRRRTEVATRKEALADVDALLLTGPFADHLDPETLSVLPRTIPAFGNAPAARRLRRLGFTNVTALHDKETAKPFDGVTIEAVRPSIPFSHNSLGYLLTEPNARAYLETHTVDVTRQGARVKGVDLALLPVQGVWLFGVPFTMSAERALEVTRAIDPAVLVPTGVDPQLAHGLMHRAMLWTRGTIDGFASLLVAAQLRTRLARPAPGESLRVA